MICNSMNTRRRGITLTEMLVVAGIIVLVLGLTVPALQVWESRKREDAINQVNGLLKAVQTIALTERKPVGLFFFIDQDTQAQVVWPIEGAVSSASPGDTADRFVLRDSSTFILPKPMRVVPISIVNRDPSPIYNWDGPQLVSDDLYLPPGVQGGPYLDSSGPEEIRGIQNHRNFFVILFDASGRLINDRDRAFYIWDPDPVDFVEIPVPGTERHIGARTVLFVNNDSDLLADRNDEAMPFAPATGVLVYDDLEFRTRGPQDDLKGFLSLIGQPLFIHRGTGRIVRGDPGLGAGA
jgi:type II secretory pathway pseudopilin PulG